MAAEPPPSVRVLGAVRIAEDDAGLGPKQALLLGALALRGGRVSADAMIDLLWGDDLPENPRAALQVHVSRLRRALEPIDAAVRFQGDAYSLVAEPQQVDVQRFERLVRDGTEAVDEDPEAAREALASALALWDGEPLGGAADDTTLRADVERLRDLRRSAVEARIEGDLRSGRHAEVIGELRQLTRSQPMHEGFWRQLLLALYRSGRAGEALAAYEEARELLVEELGADPAPELRELHRRILDQDPTLAAVGDGARRGAVPRQDPIDPASIAVLPFEVLGDEENATLLATGLHIDLLTELSRVEGLTVTSRHSVEQYDAATTSPRQVARELGVATVLLGTIRSAGSRFRLSVQLVDTTTGTHRWAESYDQEITPQNVFAVQRDLASDIAAALSRRLAPSEESATTESMEAYRLVVEGRMQFDRKTEQGLTSAVELFRRAVVLDPDYGPAWVGLADALAMTADYGYGDREELLSAAESAVVRALALLPRSADVHEALGLIAEGRHDAPRALDEYDTAIRISPSNADAHSWRAWIHLTLGRPEEALSSARRAVQLNPLSAEAVSNLALALTATGRPEPGLAEARRADDLSPGYTTAAYYAGLALYDLARLDEAVAALEPLAVANAGGLTTPWAGMSPDAALAVALVATGDTAGAAAVLDTIDVTTYPVEAGLVHLALGDVETAFDDFGRGAAPIGYGGAMLRHLHFRDIWAGLGDDPRLGELDARIAQSWNVGADPG